MVLASSSVSVLAIRALPTVTHAAVPRRTARLAMPASTCPPRIQPVQHAEQDTLSTDRSALLVTRIALPASPPIPPAPAASPHTTYQPRHYHAVLAIQATTRTEATALFAPRTAPRVQALLPPAPAARAAST